MHHMAGCSVAYALHEWYRSRRIGVVNNTYSSGIISPATLVRSYQPAVWWGSHTVGLTPLVAFVGDDLPSPPPTVA